MKTIKNINHISTKKGDTGQTKNYVNDVISKSDNLFRVLGDIDELSSSLGVAYHHSRFKDEIKVIQKTLQYIMSVVATPHGKFFDTIVSKVTTDDVAWLEKVEADLLETAEIKAEFVLPGSDSTYESALLDLSRSIARRAERELVRYYLETKRDELLVSMKYLNRLSDLLFIFARSAK